MEKLLSRILKLKESFVATVVMFITVLKAVMRLDKEQHNEMMYQLSMSIARKLFYKKLITSDELKEMHEILVKKYHPYIGELLSAKELIN